jgi:PRTRC genetic system protein C
LGNQGVQNSILANSLVLKVEYQEIYVERSAMARIFVYDGREFPDPDESKTPQEVMYMMTDFFPELTNAEIKEHKRGEDTLYELKRKVGVKG